MTNPAFLRSINIQLDVGSPDRFSHFRPTSKSARLIARLLTEGGGDSLFVVAPYGSGKSITAGYLGHLLENHAPAQPVLEIIEERLQPVDPQLAAAVRTRRLNETRGLFVPLYGHLPAASTALQESILGSMRRNRLGREARTIERIPSTQASQVVHLLAQTSEKLEARSFDRLVIVWDEFGRHLQGLISEGRPEELDVLQVLAEVAARQSRVPVSLVLLLHRSLLGYASGLPSGIRREWAKIEGRFDTLQYLDDSSELYELVGTIVSENRDDESPEADWQEEAARARKVGLFPDVGEDRLAPMLEAAAPLEPTTLYLLPRVAARVAQNERTLFSFLEWVSLEDSVPPSAIYDYFRGEFRTDGGPGGTQRAWLETESALQKVVAGSTEEDALKTAFLLSLGLSGERGNATYAQLLYALPDESDANPPEDILDGLIDQKLLVHRRHSDQVVVWHGTDVDLRGRLEDEKSRSTDEFNLVPFLAREAPPPVWRPVEYNARRGIRRYVETRYVSVDQLASFRDELGMGNWEPGTDGLGLYVLPRTPEEHVEALEVARALGELDGRGKERVFIAAASEITALQEAALELWCLLRMSGNRELIESDPLVRGELDHLTDDVRTGLQPLLDRVVQPQRGGSRWFRNGEELHLTSVTDLRRSISEAMDEVFELTPEIASEMVVRRSPTSIIINARKKVELGFLERYGQEAVGIEGDFADKAIFRAVFLRTGLYRKEGEHWRLTAPKDLEGPGLAAVWDAIRTFYAEPGRGKNFRVFIDRLREPPYGVREGLIPLLLAAGIKAFPTAIAIRHRSEFVADLLPSVIEDICKSPEEYVLDVVGLSSHEQEYLLKVAKLFSAGISKQRGDFLRQCMDAVVEWRHRLPEAASTSRFLSERAKRFEEALRTEDPVTLFLETLPELAGAPVEDLDDIVAAIAALKAELERVQTAFEKEAIQALSQTLRARGIHGDGNARKRAAQWASHFPTAFARKLPDRVSQGLLSRLRAPYKTDAKLVNALAILLVGRPIRQWDDSVVLTFRRQLRSAFDSIESAALGFGERPDLDDELRDGLAALALTKAESAAEHLAGIAGPDEAATALESIAASLRSRAQPGLSA